LHRWKVFAAAALLAVAALHVTTIPQTFWEYDEHLFAMGVEHFQPLVHHPPPPGSPLFIAFTKVVAIFTKDVFTALIATSLLALVAGLIAFTGAFRAISGSNATAVLATALLYVSPAVLVSATLPQSDAGALALYGFAIWACTRGNPIAAGIACAAAIGWRPQFSIAVAPMLLTTIVLMRTWRDRAIAVATFALGCLGWFVPLVLATGGPQAFWKWLFGQAAYYAAHDADLSRSGYSPAQLAVRFVAHPWGPKWLAIPVLLLATYSSYRSYKSYKSYAPLAVGCLTYLAFAIATMDPADAVRYAIPSLPLIALLAGRWWWFVPLYAIGAYWYASPLIRTRATSVAPPTAAIRWIEANVPRNAIVVYDAPLRPHAENLLRGWRTTRSSEDMSAPMVLLADGEQGDAKGVTFRWPDTDAYRKLTRQHYGAVSVIPVPPEERFRVIEGVFPSERTRDGKAWRWIAARGVIELPDLGATHARFVFRAPPEYPLDTNTIRVNNTTVTLRRDSTAEVIVPLTERRITINPERSFVPADVPGANNHDQRTLSVMLIRVEQQTHPPQTR